MPVAGRGRRSDGFGFMGGQGAAIDMGKALNKIEEARARLQSQAERVAASELGGSKPTRPGARGAPAAETARPPVRSNNGAQALMTVALFAVIFAAFGIVWLSFHRSRSVRISAAPRTITKEAKARGLEARQRFVREFERAVKMGSKKASPTPAPQPAAPAPAPAL